MKNLERNSTMKKDDHVASFSKWFNEHHRGKIGEGTYTEQNLRYWAELFLESAVWGHHWTAESLVAAWRAQSRKKSNETRKKTSQRAKEKHVQPDLFD